MELMEFDPVLYSVEENNYLKTALGQPPVVALRNLPPKVNPNAVRPIITRVYELEQLKAAEGQPWAGVEPLKAAIDVYLGQAQKWAADRRKGRPRFPSMYAFDGKGRPHRQGPGSDTDQVRTYFDQNGERRKFAVDLLPHLDTGEWTPDWTQAQEDPQSVLNVETDKRRIECRICGHTESFNPDNRASFNAARARMSKHLRSSTVEVEAHREAHTLEFGQAS